MKNWKQFTFVAIIAIVGIIIGFMACDKDNGTTTHTHEWEWIVTTPATATADGVETETCKTCGETRGTRPIERTEPAKKNFTVSFDFQNQTDPSFRYEVAIVDKRTACGSADLENVKVGSKDIITIIEEAIMGAFNSGIGPSGSAMRGRFRDVFNITGGVTIYVDNPTTAYKIKATDNKSIYFYIDYLKSSPTDIQQNIVNAVNAMAGYNGATLPYNAE